MRAVRLCAHILNPNWIACYRQAPCNLVCAAACLRCCEIKWCAGRKDVSRTRATCPALTCSPVQGWPLPGNLDLLGGKSPVAVACRCDYRISPKHAPASISMVEVPPAPPSFTANVATGTPCAPGLTGIRPWAVGVGLLWRRGAVCWRRGATRRGATRCRCGATRWRCGATRWRAVSVLGITLLVTALGAALLVTGFTGLLLRPGTLAVVPPIIATIPPGGLRIRGCCDHHASTREQR